jgi:hypothetical protein
MLIYLDANIIQYCADFKDFILGNNPARPTSDAKLLKELEALRTLFEIEHFGEGWEVAAPAHLMKELLKGRPSPKQQTAYVILIQARQDSTWHAWVNANEEKILSIERSLRPLSFRDTADRRHLAEAIALNATWFLTNDSDIIKKTRRRPAEFNAIAQGIRVSRPSECIGDISVGLFLR